MRLYVLALATKLTLDSAVKNHKDFSAQRNAIDNSLAEREKSYLFCINRGIGYSPNIPEVTYSADNQRFLPLADSNRWLAEMNGYTIGDRFDWKTPDFDGAETVENVLALDTGETYGEIGENVFPGAIAELMDTFGDVVGPWEATVKVDLEALQRYINQGWSSSEALRLAEMDWRYNEAVADLAKASGDSEADYAKEYNFSNKQEKEPGKRYYYTLGYEAVVEDQGFLLDQEFTRGQCDSDDSWLAESTRRQEEKQSGPSGICLDRVKEMRRLAEKRQLRFIHELDFITRGNLAKVRIRYAWNRNPKHTGAFWSELIQEHSLAKNGPEPGLKALNNSHTVLINFAYRRRLNLPISPRLENAAIRACSNLAKYFTDSERCPEYLLCEDFNLCDIEGTVSGQTPYFFQLASYYASQPNQG